MAFSPRLYFLFHSVCTQNQALVAGIVLKMAQMIKDTSMGGQSTPTDVVRKPETMIIPARELVQVFAKVCSPNKNENK